MYFNKHDIVFKTVWGLAVDGKNFRNMPNARLDLWRLAAGCVHQPNELFLECAERANVLCLVYRLRDLGGVGVRIPACRSPEKHVARGGVEF